MKKDGRPKWPPEKEGGWWDKKLELREEGAKHTKSRPSSEV